jgi:MFS family permease
VQRRRGRRRSISYGRAIEASTDRVRDPNPWLVLAAMCLPLVSLSVDVSGAGVALPAVGASFALSGAGKAWVLNASPLAFGLTLIPTGLLSDRAGPRRLLLMGVAGFGLASIVCAVAPNAAVLIAGRVAQGLSSSLCFTTSLSVIDAVFPKESRTRAVGVWGAAAGVGSAIGPLVAGALSSGLSWRWFFGVNAPLCLLALPVLAVSMRATATDSRREPSPWRVTDRRLFTSSMVTAFCSNWGFGVTVVLAGEFLESVRHEHAVYAGLVMLSFSVTFALAGAVVGSAGDRRRMAAWFGPVLVVCALSLGAFAALGESSPLVLVILVLAVDGLGQGLAFDLSTAAALEAVPLSSAGTAAGAVESARLLAFVAGVAIAGTVIDSAGRLVDGIRTGVAVAGAVALAGAGASVIMRPQRRCDRDGRELAEA